jgi:hypothetical protein
VREEASYHELETAAVQAVQPIIREYEHQEACQRIVGRIYIYDATREEEEAAKEAVRKALAALPIDAAAKQLEKAEETALAPYKAAVATRKEKARLESAKQAQRRAVAWKADLQLDHIAAPSGPRHTDRSWISAARPRFAGIASGDEDLESDTDDDQD